MKRFDQKTVIVTGGNSGIGKATALQFARHGANVAIIARNEKTGAEAVSEIRDAGGIASFHKADVTSAAEINNAFDEVIRRYGRFHAAFNNAGLSSGATLFNDMEFDEFDRTMKANLYSIFYCMKVEVKHYLEHGGGAIVNCSSAYGLVARTHASAYCTSKHGVVGITKAVAMEYASQGIRVNAVCPGGVMTPMAEALFEQTPGLQDFVTALHPLGRMATPEEIANLVLWLSSDEATNVIGQAYAIDGGYTIR